MFVVSFQVLTIQGQKLSPSVNGQLNIDVAYVESMVNQMGKWPICYVIYIAQMKSPAAKRRADILIWQLIIVDGSRQEPAAISVYKKPPCAPITAQVRLAQQVFCALSRT